MVWKVYLQSANYLGESDPAYFKKALLDVMVAEFQPKAGVKIQVQENEAANSVSSGIIFSWQ